MQKFLINLNAAAFGLMNFVLGFPFALACISLGGDTLTRFIGYASAALLTYFSLTLFFHQKDRLTEKINRIEKSS